MRRLKGACKKSIGAALAFSVLQASTSCSGAAPQATSGTQDAPASNVLFTGGGASNTDTESFQVKTPNIKFDWNLDGADKQAVIDFDIYAIDQNQRNLTSHIAHQLNSPPYEGQESVRLTPGTYLIHVTTSVGTWKMTVTNS